MHRVLRLVSLFCVYLRFLHWNYISNRVVPKVVLDMPSVYNMKIRILLYMYPSSNESLIRSSLTDKEKCVSVLQRMNLPHMVIHLILPGKRSTAEPLTAFTSYDTAPELGGLLRVSTVIVSFEVVPASEGSFPTARHVALEGESVGTGRAIHGTNLHAIDVLLQ